MKTSFDRQQELEGLLRRGGLSASRVIDRYVALCDELLPLTNILAHVVTRIIEIEIAAHLVGSGADKKSESPKMIAVTAPDERVYDLSSGAALEVSEKPVRARTVGPRERRTAGLASAR